MWDFLRKIPLLTYGRCGGEQEDCSDKPITDPMDLAFKEHDEACYLASLNIDPKLVDQKKTEADHALWAKLNAIDPSKLNLYGKLYRAACLIIFR